MPRIVEIIKEKQLLEIVTTSNSTPDTIYDITYNGDQTTNTTTFRSTTPIPTTENLFLPVDEEKESTNKATACARRHCFLNQTAWPIDQLLRHPQVDLGIRYFLSNHGFNNGAQFNLDDSRTQKHTLQLIQGILTALAELDLSYHLQQDFPSTNASFDTPPQR